MILGSNASNLPITRLFLCNCSVVWGLSWLQTSNFYSAPIRLSVSWLHYQYVMDGRESSYDSSLLQFTDIKLPSNSRWWSREGNHCHTTAGKDDTSNHDSFTCTYSNSRRHHEFDTSFYWKCAFCNVTKTRHSWLLSVYRAGRGLNERPCYKLTAAASKFTCCPVTGKPPELGMEVTYVVLCTQ